MKRILIIFCLLNRFFLFSKQSNHISKSDNCEITLLYVREPELTAMRLYAWAYQDLYASGRDRTITDIKESKRFIRIINRYVSKSLHLKDYPDGNHNIDHYFGALINNKGQIDTLALTNQPGYFMINRHLYQNDVVFYYILSEIARIDERWKKDFIREYGESFFPETDGKGHFKHLPTFDEYLTMIWGF